MKHNQFFKAFFTLILCGTVMMASAADIYVSNGAGNDTNNGLSAVTPVKTISKAFTICLDGDVIHVMDMININQEPTKTTARTDIDVTAVDQTKVLVKDGVTYTTWNAGNGTVGIIPHTRSITIQGTDKASCGFDGNDASCIIRQDHGGSGVATITYKNLTFKNGKSADGAGGGAVYFRLSNTAAVGQAGQFINCDFIENKSRNDKPGGAIAIVQQPGVVSFKNCYFARNIAAKGGAIYFERGNLSIDSCVFEDHDLTVASTHLTTTFPATSVGGAIHCNLTLVGTTANLDVKNSLFKNNKVGANGGAFSTSETNPTTVITGAENIKFTNCAFVNNTTGTGIGGAVYLNMPNLTSNVNTLTTQDVTFVNCTFKGNQSGSNSGGAIGVASYYANSKFSLINCTVSDNKVTGTSGAGGAGVRFLKNATNSVRKIQNCIIENNIAEDANMANAADYADLGMENVVDPTTSAETPSYVAGTTLIIEKSLIGSCKNTDFDTQFPMSKVNYVFELNGSIANSYKAKLGAFDEDLNYFPLLAGSEAIAYGLTDYLRNLTPSVMTDQIGRTRPWTNCSAGAWEYTNSTGLKNAQKGSLVVYRNANNQLVVNNSANNAGTITICNMMGQVVATAQLSGNTTTINKALKAGAYVVMLQANGVTSTQKVILN